MKTAAQHNAPQIGYYEFRPRTRIVTLTGPLPEHAGVLQTLFEACGWRVCFKPKKKRKSA